MIEERSGGLGLACACWAWGLVRSSGRAGGSGQLGMMDWKNTSKGVCVCAERGPLSCDMYTVCNTTVGNYPVGTAVL